jgi:predicted metal-dependent phosphoesterase TrpH
MLELHCHTTCSDGTLTPQGLVAAARQAGVKALAITDHDTCAGWEEAIAAAGPDLNDLEIVPGVELSTLHHGQSLHVLGFYPDRNHLDTHLTKQVAARRRRAQKMVDHLANLGYIVTVPELAGGGAPGRPHIARALMEAGYVRSPQAAFDRLLGDDKPAYVPYEALEATAGVALLRSCGAVPVWAHPYLFRGGTVEDTLPSLIAAGLMGLEVYHPSHSPRQRDRLLDWCDHYDLIATGGSDYHGPNNLVSSGDRDQLNRFHLPLDWLHDLKRARQELEPTVATAASALPSPR